MINLSYTKSSQLIHNLHIIEEHRRALLLTGVTPIHEIELRWNGIADKVIYAMKLFDVTIPKDQVLELLLKSYRTEREPKKYDQVLSYKKLIENIYFQWTNAAEPITLKSVESYIRLIQIDRYQKHTDLLSTKIESILTYFLEYMQISPESPIVQAALSFVEIIDLQPLPDLSENFMMAFATAYMFLYKGNYELYGSICLEKIFYENKKECESILTRVFESQKSNEWIEYFTYGIMKQLETVAKGIQHYSELKHNKKIDSMLNERQIRLIKHITDPNEHITNKKIQKQFKISQITASRDLAKLSTLGFVYQHGKGRSIYYTRVW